MRATAYFFVLFFIINMRLFAVVLYIQEQYVAYVFMHKKAEPKGLGNNTQICGFLGTLLRIDTLGNAR